MTPIRLNPASEYHVPVMRDEVVHWLVTDPAGLYVDATVGGGGYFEALLPRLFAQARLVGLDRDTEALTHCRERFAHEPERVRLLQGDLGHVAEGLHSAGIRAIDGFLLDLGLSSWQIDAPRRGFAYLQDGPLDMRMDRSQGLTAEAVINQYEESALADLFHFYGEERHARRLARRVVSARQIAPIRTTLQLADVVRKAAPGPQSLKTLARVWQALRVEVNDELDQLKSGLMGIYPFLKPGARVVILSYESLSDRMVKRFFRGDIPDWREDDSRFPPAKTYHFEVLTRRVQRPGEAEVATNPRARSAKLRVAERLSQ